jgi:hypothetical protein
MSEPEWTESTGEEWKAGTPYEDPEERAMRNTLRALGEMIRSMKALARSMESVSGAMIPLLAVREAVRLLVLKGVDREDARRLAMETATVAAAEGRPVAKALRRLVATQPEEGG